MVLLKYYRKPYLNSEENANLIKYCKSVQNDIDHLDTEICFYVDSERALTLEEEKILFWLLSETFEMEDTRCDTSYYNSEYRVEIGPRMSFSTAWSSNAVAICGACGLSSIVRIEKSKIYYFNIPVKDAIKNHLFDRMTEEIYVVPLTQFTSCTEKEQVKIVPILEKGKGALMEMNSTFGFGFDDWDLEYYTNLFLNDLKRNPTNVECFDLAQSNSEHSRHWFFGGKLVLNGKTMPSTLFKMVKDTLNDAAKKHSVIAFHDNSSVIMGDSIHTLVPKVPTGPSSLAYTNIKNSHLLLTAETHNFPTGIAPFAGAETGTGGRIRDVQATGRGAHVIAGISAYSVGNLYLDEYDLPWEDAQTLYPTEKMATPLEIMVQASNGASTYGNKFGEPVVAGFSRSFGMRLPCGERREYVKPIMFSAGVGQIDAIHCKKGEAETGLWIIKIGGPAYRIGMGGGAASSRVEINANALSSSHLQQLDFNAVQRGDAEMENKMNRVIRACIQLGDKNPIVSIHDQGAGGNGNVLKEIVEPTKNVGGGARYNVRDILIGDDTLSILEIWVAEYQENNAVLVHEKDLTLFDEICQREKSPYCALGQVTGDGVVVLYDQEDESTPVHLPLSLVLADMPQKTFVDNTTEAIRKPLELPRDISIAIALDRVLRLATVGSKRFLTTKVDRSVSGLIAQQQCVGPLHTPLADVAVVAQSHFPTEANRTPGIATAVGEQPIKGLLDNASMARLSVGEALTNLVWAPITDLTDCKCSANWMWAAKLPGEACAMYEACRAMSDIMKTVGVSIDGGKDSLSMSANVGREQVKSPGTLVITMYAPCPDVQLVVTPDLKTIDEPSSLYYIDLGSGYHRLGGSALAQVYSQIGNESPDVFDAELLKRAFETMQEAIRKQWILAGHDRSDGGIIVTLMEMAFAGNCGFNVHFKTSSNTLDAISLLFSEELGFIVQVKDSLADKVESLFKQNNVPFVQLGKVVHSPKLISVKVNDRIVLEDNMVDIRDTWEATGFEIEKLQCNPKCVEQEKLSLRLREHDPEWKLSFTPQSTSSAWMDTASKHKVAILREEGSNGDREMHSAFFAAGFEVWDVTMTDLVEQRISLQEFQGIAFVGGFSFADVLGSAKGWAAVAKFHDNVWQELQAFKARNDTFSLGVCNGCQLMALLGWVTPTASTNPPRFIENTSGRYESRFVNVQIQKSIAIMLQGMEGTSMGVWIAHGEGRAHFPEDEMLHVVEENDLAPIRYVDDKNQVAEQYPFNPNGSINGIAGLCSSDGRHLCMMPHPERCFLPWQWPWMPNALKQHDVSPWLQLFQNAKKFCMDNTQ